MTIELLPEIFTERFRRAYEDSDFPSYSSLSEKAGVSRPMAGRIASGSFDRPHNGPGVFTVKRLASAMSTSVGYLLSEDLSDNDDAHLFFSGTKKSKGVIERLMETHWRGAGRIEAFSNLMEYCDIYKVPQAEWETPKITRVGRRTLMSARLGGPFLADAQRELNAMKESKRKDILEFHKLTEREGTAIGCSFLNHDLRTRPARVNAANIRLGLLVKDQKGSQSILLHASPIPA